MSAVSQSSRRTPATRRVRRREQARRHRQREREHVMVPCMSADGIGEDEIEFLIAQDWLDPRDADDRRKVGTAIGAALKDAARAHKLQKKLPRNFP
jgi:hypothetical protein